MSDKHGNARRGAHTTEYTCWRNMMRRCYSPYWPDYHRYGGRGIKVCDNWKDFASFLRDMGSRPKGMYLDRIDNDGDYEPGNCRWVTPKESAHNRTWNSPRKITVEMLAEIRRLLKSGISQRQIATRFGVCQQAISKRLTRRQNAEAGKPE